MAVRLPNGATISIGSTYATVATVTAATNANPAVLTLSASHGVVVGDIFELTSGWSRANSNMYRASVVSVNDVTAEGLNSSSTTNFPSGNGTGSLREVTVWTQITQILETSSSGGEQQFVTYSFLESDAESRIPTVSSPIGFALTVADDITLPHYAVLSAANDDRLQRAVRVVLPGGSIIYWAALITLRKTPTLTKNEIMALEVTMSIINQVTRFVS